MRPWVYRMADGVFLRDHRLEDVVSGEAVGDVQGTPDARLERYDSSSPTGRRAATGPEMTAYDAARLSARSQHASRQKDVLATCALIVRARGIATWNAMTVPQKVAATLAEADVWSGIREFLDDKS